MTWDEAVQEFMEHILPLVREQYEQDDIPDISARREAWNNWTDMLCKDGTITVEQYEDWDHPPCNEYQ